MAVAQRDMSEDQQLPVAIITLCKEHRYMSLLLDTLEEHVRGNDKIQASDYFLIHDVIHYLHEYPDAVHHPTEDLMFARLVVRDPSTRTAVQGLERDHQMLTRDTSRILMLLRAAEAEQTVAAADAVRAACKLYIERLRKHMDEEESGLFRTAVASLAARDWKAIEVRLNAVDDPLFGRTVDSRFRVLFEYFSGEAGNVSQRIARFSFLQFDSVIESAEALEQGAGNMIGLMKHHAKSLTDESKAVWRRTVDSPDFRAMLGNHLAFTTFLGKKTLDVGRASAGIYFETAKKMIAPFMNRK